MANEPSAAIGRDRISVAGLRQLAQDRIHEEAAMHEALWVRIRPQTLKALTQAVDAAIKWQRVYDARVSTSVEWSNRMQQLRIALAMFEEALGD